MENRRELIIGHRYALVKVELTSWDKDVHLDRVDVAISLPNEDDFKRANPSDMQGLLEFYQARVKK